LGAGQKLIWVSTTQLVRVVAPEAGLFSVNGIRNCFSNCLTLGKVTRAQEAASPRFRKGFSDVRVLVSAAGVFAAYFLAASAASAAVMPIALSPAPAPGVQQSQQGPCVIGEPSCNANPSLPEGWTNLPTQGNPSSYNNIQSPEYLVSNLRNYLDGDMFSVGVDVNQANGRGNQTLSYFGLSLVGDGVLAAYDPGSPTPVPPINSPGNGFSDYILSGFSLAGLEDTDKVFFELTMPNVNGGREQYFLQKVVGNGNGEPPIVPLPAAAWLLLGGIGGLSALRARRKA
jgi:hypothetical protein